MEQERNVGFENINDWLTALDEMHEKTQKVKCVNIPDDWHEDKLEIIEAEEIEEEE